MARLPNLYRKWIVQQIVEQRKQVRDWLSVRQMINASYKRVKCGGQDETWCLSAQAQAIDENQSIFLFERRRSSSSISSHPPLCSLLFPFALTHDSDAVIYSDYSFSQSPPRVSLLPASI
jgi:hypothetical protein